METEDGTVAPEIADPTGSPDLTASAPGPEADAGEAPAPQQPSINPAWAPMRDVLGEDIFDVNVMPHLQKFDEAANTRITNLNAQLKSFEGYAPFVEQGIDPSSIEMAMNLVKMIESDPKAFYAQLGEHLGVGGEEDPETLENFGAGQENAMEVPPHIQAQLEQLQQFQQQVLEREQQQQMEAQQAQAIEAAGQEIDREMSEFLQKNPSFTEEDKGELFRMQYELTKQLEARGIQRMATIEEAAAAFNERAAYYRSRGNAGAPSTLPTTAGGDIPSQRPNVAKMGKQDFTELIANDLLAAKAQQS